MNRTTEAIEWLRPFHEAAGGRTGEALDAAIANLDQAPDFVTAVAIREGLRSILHAFRRSSGIRVNGDAETMPLFVASHDEHGVLVHRPRFDLTVAEIEHQITQWGQRRAQAGRELTWWSHQRDLAKQANAEPTETLGAVWTRLGVRFELSNDEASA